MRCCVVGGPGGFGKTELAEGVASELIDADISCTVVQGDLVSENTSLGDDLVIIVDAADRAPSGFLAQLRADAMSPTSNRSLLLLARAPFAAGELAELSALADRDDRLVTLSTLSLDELAARIPPDSSIDPSFLSDLTGAIPLHVDRLCTAWEQTGWPDIDTTQGGFELGGRVPERFVQHIEIQMGRLDTAERVTLGALSFAETALGDGDDVTQIARLVDAGLIEPDSRVPNAVAAAVRQSLMGVERELALGRAGITLLQTNAALAADLADGLSDPPSWAAIAWAAAGRFTSATEMIDAQAGHTDGALLAAHAHVAASESRWNDAARLSAEIAEHPYWSTDKIAAVARLYACLDASPAEAQSGAEQSDEPAARFLCEAVDAFVATMLPDGGLPDPALSETGPTALGDRLRSVARQASNQQPTLDIAVSGSELAAIAALLSGEFEVARTLIERSPESSSRSAVSEALEEWVTLRAGAPTASAERGGSPPSDAAAVTEGLAPRVLSLAAKVMESRRSGDIDGQAAVLDELVAIGSMLSVDALTFDALCELYLGAQRVDARREARELGRGLDAFVDRLGAPLYWDARRRWNEVESAVAGGDAEAVAAAAKRLADIPGIDDVLAPLVAAAGQWVRVLNGQIDKSSLDLVLDELETHGFVWEAASLAGQAAIRSSNADLAKDLLQRGRDFRQAAPATKITSPAGLSEREIEVGLLVLAGHSYKEIGATCFISPKTVEHHISHIRQKLTAVGVSRAEFRAALAADLNQESSSSAN